MRTWSGPPSSGWWLHIDLDVLDGNKFSACAAAGDPAMPGLSWSKLLRRGSGRRRG
jgi:hypothetical protein